MRSNDITPIYLSDSTPSLDDVDYFASLEAMIEAKPVQQKPSDTPVASVDTKALLSAFNLLDRALQMDSITPEQAESMIAKAERKLSAARPKRHDKFASVDLTALIDKASEPIPMLQDAFLVGDTRPLVPMSELIWISAPPASGKSFLTASQCLALAGEGKTSVFIDFESTPEVFTRRLLQLGATVEDIKHITYLSPSAGWSAAEMREIIAQAVTKVVETNAQMLVVDGFAQASVRLGFDENSNTDMSLFADALSGIAYSTGTPVVVIDHVSKIASESGSRWMRGASAKLAQPALAFTVKVAKSPAMGIEGSIDLVIAKDRHGCVGSEGDIAARVLFTPTTRDIEGGLSITFNGGGMSPDKAHLTMMMLSRRLVQDGPMTTTQLRTLTYDKGDHEGKKCWGRDKFRDVVLPQLQMLADQGYLSATDEGRNKVVYAWVGDQWLTEDEAAAVCRAGDPDNHEAF